MEIIIVSKNKDLIFATFKVSVPYLKSLNNDWEFLIIGLVLSLDEDYFLREKSYWIPLTYLKPRNFRIIFVSHMIRNIYI